MTRFPQGLARRTSAAGVSRWIIVASLTVFLLSDPAMAQSLGQAGDDGVSLWRVALALLLCMGLAVGGAFLIKARSGSGQLLPWPVLARPARRLRLVETLSLRNHVDLNIVTCDGRELLVVTSEKGALLTHALSGREVAPEDGQGIAA
jgi:hypothetical protein